MKTFREFCELIQINESSGNQLNTARATLAEISTVLHIHDNSAAKKNRDKTYQDKISSLRKKAKELHSSLPKDRALHAQKAGIDMGKKWLGHMQSRRNMTPDDISEVHHTPGGIHEFVPGATQQTDPPDILVKHKKGYLGASLKAFDKSVTYANWVSGSHDRISGLGTNSVEIWKKGRAKVLRKLGVRGDLTDEKFKELTRKKQHVETVKKIYANSQREVSKHHADKFNSTDHATRLKYCLDAFKAGSKADYDIVTPNKTTARDDIPIIHRLHQAGHLYAQPDEQGSSVEVGDEHGRMFKIECRSTHGPFVSNQFNVKVPAYKDSWETFEKAKKEKEMVVKKSSPPVVKNRKNVPNNVAAGDTKFYADHELGA